MDWFNHQPVMIAGSLETVAGNSADCRPVWFLSLENQSLQKGKWATGVISLWASDFVEVCDKMFNMKILDLEGLKQSKTIRRRLSHQVRVISRCGMMKRDTICSVFSFLWNQIGVKCFKIQTKPGRFFLYKLLIPVEEIRVSNWGDTKHCKVTIRTVVARFFGRQYGKCVLHRKSYQDPHTWHQWYKDDYLNRLHCKLFP